MPAPTRWSTVLKDVERSRGIAVRVIASVVRVGRLLPEHVRCSMPHDLSQRCPGELMMLCTSKDHSGKRPGFSDAG